MLASFLNLLVRPDPQDQLSGLKLQAREKCMFYFGGSEKKLYRLYRNTYVYNQALVLVFDACLDYDTNKIIIIYKHVDTRMFTWKNKDTFLNEPVLKGDM